MSFFSSIFGAPNLAPGPAPAPVPPPPPPAPEKEPDMLDSLVNKDFNLWANPETNKKDASPPPDPFTPEAISTQVKQLDFSKAITPEVLAAIKAGGDGATDALISAMNLMSQQAAAQSIFMANQIANRAADKAKTTTLEQIPGLTRKQALDSIMSDSSPAYNHLALRPLYETVQTQMSLKFPTATPQQLAEFTTAYMHEFAKKVMGANTGTAEETKKPTDWSSLFA